MESTSVGRALGGISFIRVDVYKSPTLLYLGDRIASRLLSSRADRQSCHSEPAGWCTCFKQMKVGKGSTSRDGRQGFEVTRTRVFLKKSWLRPRRDAPIFLQSVPLPYTYIQNVCLSASSRSDVVHRHLVEIAVTIEVKMRPRRVVRLERRTRWYAPGTQLLSFCILLFFLACLFSCVTGRAFMVDSKGRHYR